MYQNDLQRSKADQDRRRFNLPLLGHYKDFVQLFMLSSSFLILQQHRSFRLLSSSPSFSTLQLCELLFLLPFSSSGPVRYPSLHKLLVQSFFNTLHNPYTSLFLYLLRLFGLTISRHLHISIMRYTAASFLALAGLVAAEVPQEHSHEQFLIAVDELLALNNPLNIQAAVFGLLGNAAASEGAGLVTDPDCLHQATADQAFTNAKEAGDVDGMANALIFRAIERNTGSVGLKSVICTETPVNPEIAALTQHQDPASEGAAEENKRITLALAQQLALVGADPQLALKSGTFAPGEVSRFVLRRYLMYMLTIPTDRRPYRRW